MANKVEHRLSEQQMKALTDLPLVFLITHDQSKSWPITHAISWVYAKDETTIRFAIEADSLLVKTLADHPVFTLIFFADQSTYSLTCTDVAAWETTARLPLKVALYEGQIKEVRDILFYGAAVSDRPRVHKTYDEAAALQLDQQIQDILKG
ncbi:hypothetical protein [Exiguobacterium artemiae]|uniref:hypothetical protein n=1 Tax=Exiguobacterium artemiae TaxID=340145 RepID=UPI00047D303C|nr:hypothetical protein [Exiguobacterium sibiricum]